MTSKFQSLFNLNVVINKGTKAFCSGGDQALRSTDGYSDYESFGRLNVLDLQVRKCFCFLYITACSITDPFVLIQIIQVFLFSMYRFRFVVFQSQ